MKLLNVNFMQFTSELSELAHVLKHSLALIIQIVFDLEQLQWHLKSELLPFFHTYK